jgi:LPS sulfotransferase NodH
MMTRKFCILTTERCGSNALVSLLRLVPDTICHGELFSKTGVWPALEPALDIHRSVAHREENPLAFLDEVERHTFKLARTFGFKLFIGHSGPVLLHVITSGEYHVILLSRANTLAQFASLAVAEASGTWHSRRSPSQQPHSAVRFDKETFEVFVRRIDRLYTLVRKRLETHQPPNFAIEYRDIKNARTIDSLGAFLGMDRGTSLSALVPSIPHVKQGSPVITERFSNPEDVVAAMRELGHEDWLIEEEQPSRV